MSRMKPKKPLDFGDILAALDREAAARAPSPPAGEGTPDDDPSAPETPPSARAQPARTLRAWSESWPISRLLQWSSSRRRARLGLSLVVRAYASVCKRAAGALRFAPKPPATDETAEPSETVASGPRAPEPRQTRRPQTEDEAIAAELGLRPELEAVDLKRIRRDFAKKNHPDRFAPAQRTGAARRMSIANMLIDAHLKQKPSAE